VTRIRIGSALFNADHSRLGDEIARLEAAGVDFLHLDVFDGYAVPDQAFAARTIAQLRTLTALPFEAHLAAREPTGFIRPLAAAGVDLLFLPAETTPLIYEAIFAVREAGMRPGLVLALGTPLSHLDPVLPLVDAVLLLGRVTGEGARGRDLNPLLYDRVRATRQKIDAAGLTVDLQAAGGLEREHCADVVRCGATSLPLGATLHRETDLRAFLHVLRGSLEPAAPIASVASTAAAAAPPSAGASVSHPARRWRVLIASRSFGKSCPDVLDRLRQEGCDLISTGLARAPSEDELLALVGDVEAIVSGTEPLSARVLGAAPRLRVISKHGVGVENIDLSAARSRGIEVRVAGGAIADSVADLAMGLLLALARQLPAADAATRAGAWDRFVGTELRDRTLGVVGLGQIGRAVCRRASGFGMRLLATDALPDRDFAAKWGIQLVSLADLLPSADFVSLHVPVTPETRGLIGEPQLASMKSGSFLINTARGELVDEGALTAALVSGHLGGAACDAFQREPPVGSPLLQAPNFIATPHCGGQTTAGLRRMGEITAENLLQTLQQGETAASQV
jgi:D-3-phosphoglycerate dehydrogenase